jgi:predicted RNA binding protein YcfA (HicA-like mRNA interferase family)
MPTRDFSGRDIVSVLTDFGYVPTGRTGSHVQLRYEHPETGEIRTVTVPMHDRISLDTLQHIASQCGATEFDAWCRWIDSHR